MKKDVSFIFDIDLEGLDIQITGMEGLNLTVTDIIREVDGFVFRCSLFYFLPESATLPGQIKPPGIEATIEMGEILRADMLQLINTGTFYMEGWAIWEIQDSTIWNLDNTGDNEAYRHLVDLIQNQLPRKSATISITGWM